MQLRIKERNKKIRLYCIVSILSSVIPVKYALADDYFDPRALSYGAGQPVADIEDLEAFSRPNGQRPGNYIVDIYINNQPAEHTSIPFVLNTSDNTIYPVFLKKQLTDWGVKLTPDTEAASVPDDEAVAVSRLIPDADSKFNFSLQRLDISIPQIYIDKKARGSISPELWDQGITAAMLNYNFTGSETQLDYDKKEHTSEQFLNLRSGINFAGWRLRNYSTYSRNNHSNKWNSIQTYLSHQIVSMKSQFSAGEVNSSGDIFDSFVYKGILLESDEGMLPDSQKGFAPVVRGIANSNAQVTIRQNNNIIYQTYVSPGAFEINDLYPTSYSGNLDVTVEEADGSRRTFVVPFSSLAIMQREGNLKYSVSGGRYGVKNNADTYQPEFIQTTAMYGLPHDITIYGGQIFSDKYNSVAAGLGFSLGEAGAVSADVTHAVTRYKDRPDKNSGQSYRFQYSKSMTESGTMLTLAGYRYSTKEFYTFSEANNYNQIQYNRRSRFQANLNQSLDQYGSLYLSAYQQDYWGRSGTERNFSAGYNATVNNISYGLNYNYNKMPYSETDHQLAFSVNIPLSNWYPGSNNYLTSSMSFSREGRNNFQAGFSGTALENNQLNYNVSQSYVTKGQGASGNADIAYSGAYGNINAGYGYSSHYQRINYGVQGGIVAHPYGITLSQSFGETLALVRAPDADNIRLKNLTGVSTDWRGYAVVPYISPYSRNDIALDVDSLGEETEITGNSKTVIPTKGAVVLADFDVRKGVRVLITLTNNKQKIPFGAVAVLTGGKTASQSDITGITGDNGLVYMSGMPESGELLVQWGADNHQQCRARYLIPETQGNKPVKQINAECL
ncbi:TPA: fimbrial biogenesis outer membrane usher protein [Morganella morganii subsp. morganii]|uniref:Fimbrial biogenesis outer membrane usher protein n=1 Tax=Morganella morganii TaxID=582 RepID=A0AAU8ZMS5_MORMO|nr:fimbria/pilus outer membrane usher protein [Morganella morganii]HDU8690978.1 fimbrial biogenesis outer membrane usher protein [Morganella morganii subsp. morganii]AWC94154.1 hypothetical protein AM380_11155 [Morganella morganii]EKW8487858.1 fimbrial biogenesis outer membrane usher protein [Morganella morganii]HAT3626649.1 fimbrial biogenesis outer membrane usher protein [Morganella morganii]HCU0879765.1 fimbrial biogenesis outer membrane usher protein [Morganella morganii]